MSLASANVGNMGNRPDESGELLSEAMHQMLSIKPGTESTFYKLLGIDEDETNADVISNAADRQMAHVRSFQTSDKYRAVLKPILDRISRARVVLLDAKQKATYDETLRARRAQQDTRARVAAVVPTALPVAKPLPTVTAPAVEIPALRIERSVKPRESNGYQKYLGTIAAAGAVVAASIGAALWATSSSSKGSNENLVAAKAELQPGKSDPPVAPTPVAPVQEKQQEPVAIEPIVHSETPSAPEEEITPLSTESSNSFVGLVPETPAIATPPSTTPLTPPATPEPRRGLQDLLAAETPVVATNDAPKTIEKSPVILEKDVSDMKATLADITKAKSGSAKIDAILELAQDPEMKERDAAIKAIYEFAFDTAIDMNDLQRSKNIYARMASRPTIFPRTTLEGKNGQQERIIDLIKKLGSSKEMKRPEKAMDRQLLAAELLAFANAKAQTDPEAALRILPAARATLGTQMRDVKADFDKRAAETDKLIKKVQDEKALVQKELIDFDRANTALIADPSDKEARRIRGQIYLSRGALRPALEDLAVSSHAKASLAARTLVYLNTPPSNSGGKESLAVAREWKQLADMTTNGKRDTLRHAAASMYEKAITAEKSVLNPIEKKLAEKELNELRSSHTSSVETVEHRTSWKSLLPAIDPSKHSVVPGKWSKNQRGELVVEQFFGLTPLVLPWKVSSENYDVRFQFDLERTAGDNAFQVILPIGKGAVVTLNGWPEDGVKSGITNIRGESAGKNESTVKGLVLPGGKHTVEVRMSKDGLTATIEASVDGKSVIKWSGDVRDLSPHKDMIIEPQHAGVSAFNSSFVISGIRVQEEATNIPEAPKENAEPKRPKNVPKEAMWSPETGKWYAISTQKVSMVDAMVMAKASGASLVTPDSQEEGQIIQKLAGGRKVWIGLVKNLRDGGVYKLDGTPAKYLNWAQGEGTNNQEEFILMNEDGTLADYPRTTTDTVAGFEWKAK